VFDVEVRAELETCYGLDRPLLAQYAAYLRGAVTGDLGCSIRPNQPVSELLAAHLPSTLLLAGTVPSLASLLALLGGVEAAWKQRCTQTDLTGLQLFGIIEQLYSYHNY
jgi:ABC-type dipeptide/oligopeptide/nickel transport system permease component